jgi:hypothetical protein
LTSSASSATYPFSIGVGFRKGEAQPGQITTNLTSYQVVVLRKWNDGSVKHAIISGRAALTQNTARTVSVGTGTGPTGTALTASSIQSAAPSASIQCGSIGTVNLSSLLGNPVRTWVSGPEMVECHYRGDVGGGTLLSAWFHVRLYADGRVWVRAIVENGYLDNGAGAAAANANRSYVPSISIGGTVVYNNGGGTLTHHANTRYMAEGWIGGNPQVTPLHNVAALRASKLVPNYAFGGASAATLNALTQTYTPMSNGQHTPTMGNTGYQSAIGILPDWEALYCANGDNRALRSVLANASHLNSYALCFRGRTSQQVPNPANFANWNIRGPGTGGTDTTSAGSLVWEKAHHPSGGYLAYLLTGEYWHYETMLFLAHVCYQTVDVGGGTGINRQLRGQNRAVGWMLRSVGQAAALATDADIASGQVGDGYRNLLANNYANLESIRAANGTMVWSGSLYQYQYGNWNQTGDVADWMTDFWVQANGHVSEIEPLATMTNLISVRNHMYRWVVGRLGAVGTASQFPFVHAAQYAIKVANSNAGTTWYQSWGEVYTQTTGSTNNGSGNTLQGSSGGNPAAMSVGYWGNLHPAIAYAVEHGAAGAADAWNRLTNASNYASGAETFRNNPVFGISPR